MTRCFLMALLIFGLAGCTSWNRMVRISPWSDSDGPTVDRVNLWPLAYREGDNTAVLWPLMDFDAAGFAVRPLVVSQDRYFSILYPWSQWDNRHEAGWALPFYWNREIKGLFPLYHLGNFNHLGPLWWNNDGSGNVKKSLGLFPLASYGAFNHIGPLWWRREADKPWKEGGLFPVLWTNRKCSWLLPVFYHFARGEERHTYTLLGNHYANARTAGLNIYPCWWSQDRPHGKTRLLVPLLFYDENKSTRTLITPLAGRGWDASGETRFVNFMGPVYFHGSTNDSATTAILWPLYFSRRNPEKSFTSLAPLFWHEKNDTGKSLNTLLFSQHWDAAGHTSRVNCLMGLLFDHKLTKDKTDTRVLLFYRNRKQQGETSWRLWPLASYCEDARAPDFLYPTTLFAYRNNEQRRAWHLAGPLLFDCERCDREIRWSALLGTLRYKKDNDSSAFSLLYRLYRQESKNGETARDIFPFIKYDTGPHSARFSFLWRLIHFHTTPERTQGHVFFIPFG